MKSNLRFLYVGIIILCSTLAATAHAKERVMAQPMKHEIRVHVDPEQQNVYWPATLPFYIRLTASPEEGAPSFLLKNIAKANKEGLQKYAENGIALELDGRQFIRWYNYVTKDTMILKFFADGLPPKSEIQLTGAPKYATSSTVYFGNGLKCGIVSHDGISGVKQIYTSIDGADFEAYQDVILCTKEKEYSVRYYAVDWVGNAAPPEESQFIVDLTPPTTRHEVVAHFSSNILSPYASIKLTSSDRISGVREIYYKFDTQENNTSYTGQPFSVNHLPDGEHVLYYQAVDNVQNPEPQVPYAFYLDKTPPAVEIALDGDQYQAASQLFISPRTQVVITATDNKIGVKRIEKGINSSEFSVYEAAFRIPAETGDYKITCRGTDNLDNVSATNQLTVHLDLAEPVTRHEFVGSSYQQRGINWINKDTQIVLKASDGESGIQLIKYKIGEDPVSEYSRPFTILNEGKYEFKFWSIDRVNNQEKAQVLNVIVDNTPPEIVANFSVANIRSEKTEDNLTLEVYPRNTSIFLGATDASASSAGIWYTINGEKEEKYEMPISFKKEGIYKIALRARDRVDNESTKSLAFIIKD